MNIKKALLLIISLNVTMAFFGNVVANEGFLTGTIVKTAFGDRAIESIDPEDTITVYNFERERFAGREVYKVHEIYPIHELIFLLINDEFLCLCHDHRVYSLTRQGWVAAKDLQADESLLNNSGKPVIVYARGEINNIVTPVYNLSVKGKHNYLVSSYGVVVHNDFGLTLTISYVIGQGFAWSLCAVGGMAALLLAYEQLTGHKPRIDTSSLGDAGMKLDIISRTYYQSPTSRPEFSPFSPAFLAEQQRMNTYVNPPSALSKTLQMGTLKNYSDPSLDLTMQVKSVFITSPEELKFFGINSNPIQPMIDPLPGCRPLPIDETFNKPQILINVPAQIEPVKTAGLHVFPVADESLCPRIEIIPIPAQRDLSDNINAMGKEKTKYIDENGKEKWYTPRDQAPGWNRLPGNQGWQDPDGNRWKKDHKHKDTGRTSRPCDHWDVANKQGKKIREVDEGGNEIWPNGPKNKNKMP